MSRRAILAWVYGLGSAAIGGAATAVLAMVVEPGTFNFEGGLASLAKLAVGGGLINAAMYLKQSPLPALQAKEKK